MNKEEEYYIIRAKNKKDEDHKKKKIYKNIRKDILSYLLNISVIFTIFYKIKLAKGLKFFKQSFGSYCSI